MLGDLGPAQLSGLSSHHPLWEPKASTKSPPACSPFFQVWGGGGANGLLLLPPTQVPVGANPVQVEVGEFEEGAEEAEEEVVAESRSLPHVLPHPVFALCRLGVGTAHMRFLPREMRRVGGGGGSPPSRAGCGGETALT